MDMIQISLLGVVGVLFLVQLKQEKAQFSVCFCMALSIVIFISILDELKELISTLKMVSDMVKINTTYIATLIKMLGITYIAEFASGICKDAGYQALASQIEVFGKVTILVLSLPILMALLRTIQEFFV